MDDLKLEYHYGNHADSYTFYRIPKILFTDSRFEKMSVEAKLLYGLMLDRMALSIKNNWLDDKNRVYIYFTIEDACEMLKIGNTKMIRIFAELDTTKGIGLIERKKQGQGKPTIIYVKNFASLVFIKPEKEEKKSYPKPNFKTSQNETSDDNNHEDGSDFEGDLSVESEENVDVEVENMQSVKVKTFANETSRSSDNECADISNVNANNTNPNNTDFSDNYSIYPSISPYQNGKSEMHKDRMSDGMSNDAVEMYATHKLWEEKAIPYEFTQDYRLMKAVVHELTEWEHHKTNAESDDRYGDSFEYSTFKLFNEALVEMLTDKQTTVRGALVTYAKVYDKIAEYVKFDGAYCTIYNLQETAIGDFQVACSQRDIKNHLAYMKSCIWNAMQVGEIGIQAKIKKDFG